MKASIIILGSLFLGAYVAPACATDPSTTGEAAQYPADNTGRNVRDSHSNTLTAGDQSNRASDVKLAQKIRRHIVADRSLSTMAHNVKIITADGVVTLRGPVKTQGEKQRVAAAAERIAGQNKVHNDLEIAQ